MDAKFGVRSKKTSEAKVRLESGLLMNLPGRWGRIYTDTAVV